MQKFFDTRSQAREFAKMSNGKVVDAIDKMPSHKARRWMVEYEDKSVNTSVTEDSIFSDSMGYALHKQIEADTVWYHQKVAAQVANRDNSRVLMSRNKREGKYRARLWNNFAKSVECALKAVKETGCTLREGFAKERP